MKNKNSDIHIAIISGVKKTFEEMAFIDVVESGDSGVKFSHILYIDILEPIVGKIAMFLPFECKNAIAQNIYGKDIKELKSEEIDDCQLELLNVLVGNVLSFYYGGKKKYKVDLPSILFDENEIEWNRKETNEYFFDAEGCIFKLIFEINKK
jgi:hypothetical protein